MNPDMLHPDLSTSMLWIVALLFLAYAFKRAFAVPVELRHLPNVPVFPTLLSYARGEVEDVRIRKLILPFAQRGEPAVLVYALGRWIVHILDYKLVKDMSTELDTFPKQTPPDGNLFWRLTGSENVVMNNGAPWRRLSRVVRAAFERNLPIEQFELLARRLFVQMGEGGRLRWDDFTMRYTLDAIGTCALGHDFDAIGAPEGPFVKMYNEVMEDISNPMYMVLPVLERLFPRKHTMRAIDELVEAFQGILRLKRHNPGNDMLTYMLEDKETTDVEHRDNIVTFFIAGHDTTAGAMSSLCYFMALYPNIQRRAREEVRLALASNASGEPTLAELRAMPYLNACIRESLRFNTPLVEVVPRTCTRDTVLRAGNGQEVVIPAGASLTINVHTVHHREDYWDGASEFNPDRFVGAGEGMDKEYDSTHWMSFGLGPRQCPARNFAMYEQRTLYAMLLNEWEWSLPEDSPHRAYIKNGFSPFALSLPKDLYVDFKRRV